MKTQFIKYATAVAIAATVFTASAASAGDHNLQIETRAVSYADLNLALPADQEKLQARIRSAAKTVCDLNNTRRLTARQSQAGRACYKDAIASAMDSIPTHATAVAQAGS